MKYFKNVSANGMLSRLDAAEVNTSNGEEISSVEYKCMRVGMQVFLNGKNPDTLTAKDWGAEELPSQGGGTDE